MKRFFAQIIFLSLACVLLYSCGSKEAEENKEVAKMDVKTFALEETQSEGNVHLPGELKAFQEVDIYAKVSSFVKEVLVDRGSSVKKGQTLLILDAPEIQSQLSEAASKLKSKEAQLKSSKATYMRLLETSKTIGA